MLCEESFDTGTVAINYAVGPTSGPPLLLLYGLSHCWHAFLPLVPFLVQDWQVYAPDFRGQLRPGLEHYQKTNSNR